MGTALFTNNASTTLASGITDVATSLTVASGKGALFPVITGSDYFYCTLINTSGIIEIIKVTARSTDTFTIVRGQDNTTNVAWNTGDTIELRLVSATLETLHRSDQRITNTSGAVLGSPGASSADATLDIFGTTNAILHGQNTGTQSTTAGAAIIAYAVPTGASILSGNRLGAFVAGGSNDVTNTLANASAITAFATENWSSSQNGSNLKFEITANGATSRSVALTLGQDKLATFGGHVNIEGVTSTGATGTGKLVFDTAPTITLTNATGLPAAGVTGTAAVLGANTFTGAQVLSDQQVSRAMLLDTGYTVVDKGNISNATVTFDYTGGSVQTYTATGSTVTWATSNWPPTGNEGYLLIRGTNMGAYTHTITGITWIEPDGTTTTTLATYLAANTGRTAFQTSGVDQVLLWSRDAGTTIYGKLV